MYGLSAGTKNSNRWGEMAGLERWKLVDWRFDYVLPCEQRLHFRGMSWSLYSQDNYMSHAGPLSSRPTVIFLQGSGLFPGVKGLIPRENGRINVTAI